MQDEALEIVEVSPRDGLQNEEKTLAVEIRADLILKAVAAGARRVEAVSFVSPRRVPQMADAENVVALARSRLNSQGLSTRLIGLALNDRGFERALNSGVDEINGVVVASETFNRRNQNATIAATMYQIESMAGAAQKAGTKFSLTIAASFGCPFEGETDARLVASLAEEGIRMGAFEIALADTIGVATPADVSRRFAMAMAVEGADKVQWRCHFHNTRNTGMANAVAALQAGVRVFDASIGGIGGCPFAPAATGNIPTEDLVYMFERMGYRTSLELDQLRDTAQWLGAQLDIQPPGMVWRAGGFPTSMADAD